MTASKIRNERRRLFAAFMNALALGAIGAAFLKPGMDVEIILRVFYLFYGAYLHLVAQFALSRLEDEHD